MSRYQCPVCGFRIFNRRVRKCESCGNDLPEDLLFTKEQTAALDAQHERSKKEREARERRGKKKEWSWGGDGSSGADACGDGGGDGGGGD